MKIKKYLKRIDGYAGYAREFVSEDQEDYLYLKSLVTQAEEREVSKKRISDAQAKMHESIRELAEIKNSWIFKLLSRIGIVNIPSIRRRQA